MLFVLKNPQQITAVEKLSIKLLILETCSFVGGKRLYYFLVKHVGIDAQMCNKENLKHLSFQ